MAFHAQAHGQSFNAQDCLNDIQVETCDDSYECGLVDDQSLRDAIRSVDKYSEAKLVDEDEPDKHFF